MVLLAQAQNLITFFVALETALDPALHPLRDQPAPRELARVGAQVPDRRLARLGDAALRAGLHLRRLRLDRLHRDRRTGIGQNGLLDDPLILIGIAHGRASASPSRSRSRPSTSGRPTSTRARRPRSPASWRSRPRPPPSPSSSASSSSPSAPQVDEWQPALAVLAAISIVVGNVGALGQNSLKRMLGYSGVAQAGYMLGGLVVATEAGINALVFYLAAYALMNLAAFAVIVVRERETALRRRHPLGAGPRPRAAAARLAADDLDARPRRPAGDGRLHRQALPDRGPGRRRLHLARAS